MGVPQTLPDGYSSEMIRNKVIASFALASTGVNAASVLNNLSTHRLTKGGALKLGGKGGKVNTMTAGFANGSAKEISYDESDAILADNTQFLSTCKAVRASGC